jgi:hypothetical protein
MILIKLVEYSRNFVTLMSEGRHWNIVGFKRVYFSDGELLINGETEILCFLNAKVQYSLLIDAGKIMKIQWKKRFRDGLIKSSHKLLNAW